MKRKSKKTITKEGYYECGSCRISSETKNRMCPCPRGGCEANLKGEVIITRELKIKRETTK